MALASIEDKTKGLSEDLASMQASSNKIKELAEKVDKRSLQYRTIFEKSIQIAVCHQNHYLIEIF